MTASLPLPALSSSSMIRCFACAGVRPSKIARVDDPDVLGLGDERLVGGDVGAVRRRDDLPDRELVAAGELEVALVVGGHGHDRAGPVLHQHVVGDEHRDPLAVDGVDDGAAEPDAGLLAFVVPALAGRFAERGGDVVADLRGVRRALDQAVEIGVLGSEDEEGGAVERVGPGREDGEVDLRLLAPEDCLGALGAADPVALHRHDVLGPGLEAIEVGEQAIGVVGDPEVPLLELLRHDLGPAALAAAVDHLLVGEHGLVLGTPLHGGLVR